MQRDASSSLDAEKAELAKRMQPAEVASEDSGQQRKYRSRRAVCKDRPSSTFRSAANLTETLCGMTRWGLFIDSSKLPKYVVAFPRKSRSENEKTSARRRARCSKRVFDVDVFVHRYLLYSSIGCLVNGNDAFGNRTERPTRVAMLLSCAPRRRSNLLDESLTLRGGDWTFPDAN
jgi:hypothetical protein